MVTFLGINDLKPQKKESRLAFFFGSKLFSVDERSSALFLYKKGHHLSSYATIKAIKPNQSEV
jgi:hypothetical protein